MYIPIAEIEVRQADSTASQQQCTSGGSIAGIVIGSIAGTLLLIWIFTALGSSTNDEGYKHRSVQTSRGAYDGRGRGSRRSSAGSRSYRTYETTERPAKVVYRN